jgi:hypothetical protein
MKQIVLFAALSLAVVQFAHAEDEKSSGFYQGKQGEAKEALEITAGKKLEDVKVPDVPPPSKAD